MTDTPLGFVSDIATKDGKTYTTLVLNYEELRDNPLMLGEFVKVKTGAYYKGNDNVYLGMVISSQYRPITYDKFQEALALGRLNQLQPDENTVKNINFLHYDIVILGSYTSDQDGQFKFYPSTRQVPSLIDVTVSRLEEKELQELINVTLQTNISQQKKHLTDLGYLRIGSSATGEFKNIKKQVNVSNFRGKRTANFGKTGFGKSNENKVVLTLLKQNYPKMGVLIFDINGEYAQQTTDNSSSGLIEVFEQLDAKNNIIWFTNRKLAKANSNYYEVRSIKINFFKEPWLAIELAYQRHMLSGGGQIQYLEAAREGLNPDGGDWFNMPNRMAYVYGAFLKMNLEPSSKHKPVKVSDQEFNIHSEDGKKALLDKLNEGIDKADKKKEESGGSRDLYRYAGRLAFLKSLHTSDEIDEFFYSAMKAAIAGKTVIVDLPTVRPELVDFLSARLADNVFNEALRRYADNSGNDRLTDVLMVLEEAHNLLSRPEGIFYRIAKEGRKYGLGLLYSTQSPKTIPTEILSQTENFFVKHVSGEEDVVQLWKSKIAFAKPISDFILNEPIIGLSYVYMEPYQPFPVSVQVRLLDSVVKELKETKAKQAPS